MVASWRERHGLAGGFVTLDYVAAWRDTDSQRLDVPCTLSVSAVE